MKYIKEWHTCDRCGAEIDFFERSIISRKVYRIGGLLFGKMSIKVLMALIYALSTEKILRGL